MAESLVVGLATLRKPSGPLCLLWRHGIRPGFTEAESRGLLLGSEFVGSFNDGAEWIAHLPGIFTVGVINAPELVARSQSRGRAHGCSSPQAEFEEMYQLHKMRG